MSSFSLFRCLQNSQLINCNFEGTMDLSISQLVLSFGFYVWKQPNMLPEKNSTAIQHMCRKFVQCLVAWSSSNQDFYVCLQCPSPACSWAVKSWTQPLWLWIVSAGVTALTKRNLSVCNIIAILGIKTCHRSVCATSLGRKQRLMDSTALWHALEMLLCVSLKTHIMR